MIEQSYEIIFAINYECFKLQNVKNKLGFQDSINYNDEVRLILMIYTYANLLNIA